MRQAQFYKAGSLQARALCDYVAKSIPGCGAGWENAVAMHTPHAVVVFHDYQPQWGQMEMTVYASSPKWMTRQALRAAHGYIFDDARCRLAILRTSERNTRVRRQAKAFGYSETLVPRMRGDSEAEAVLTLTADEWRASKFAGAHDGHTKTAESA